MAFCIQILIYVQAAFFPKHITEGAYEWNAANREATEPDNHSCFLQKAVLQFYSCYYKSKPHYTPPP